MSSLYSRLKEFVEENTSHFDKAHSVDHCRAVFRNADAIQYRLRVDNKIDELPIGIETDIIYTAAFLHDIQDHKQDPSVVVSDYFLKHFILSTFTWKGTELEKEMKYNRIMSIINNVSYSKEVQGLRDVLPYPDNLYLNVISDADRLDALGSRGIKRCKQFIESRGGRIPEDVIVHAKEKLLKLYPTYFKTSEGREMAGPLHAEVEEYVKEKELALKGIPLGTYQHYKHTEESPRLYEVLGILRNGDETDEFAVHYKPLYKSTAFPEGTELYIDFKTFTSLVEVDGNKEIPRFKLLYSGLKYPVSDVIEDSKIGIIKFTQGGITRTMERNFVRDYIFSGKYNLIDHHDKFYIHQT